MSDSTRHQWSGGIKRFAPRALGNGCDQTERTCSRCGLVKITVHPPEGFPWIEWRQGDGPQVQLSTTPPCLAPPSAQASPLSTQDESPVSVAPADSTVNPRNARYPQGRA